MDNAKTLQSYNDHIDDYIAGTPQQIELDFKDWVDAALTVIPPGATVLEIGSGFGRDADYIESKGFKVIRTDAAKGFVDLLINKGHEARLLDALKDSFGTNLDMIFAHAVLLHFDPDQVLMVINKAHDCLKSGGVFAFSLKEGTGSEWSEAKLNSPRYFKYWSEADLKSLLNNSAFKNFEVSKRDSGRDMWLQVIAKK